MILYAGNGFSIIHLPAISDSILGERARADLLMSALLDEPYWQTDSIFHNYANLEAAAYLATKASPDVSRATFSGLLRRSYADVDNYCSLAYFLDRLFGDPDSRWRSDELFESLLDSIIASPLDDVYKLVPLQRLEALRKNKMGSEASDLKMTAPEGTVRRLTDFKGKTILLVLASSRCEDCREFLQDLNDNSGTGELIDAGQLAVVVLFVDDAFPDYSKELKRLDLFRASGGMILDKELYIARILPTYYMIDDQFRIQGRELIPPRW